MKDFPNLQHKYKNVFLVIIIKIHVHYLSIEFRKQKSKIF